MSRSSNVLWILGLSLVPVGCDDGEALSAQERACRRVCEKLEVCDERTDVADCERDCKEDKAHSEVYFKARAECVEELSCRHLTNELDNMGHDVCIEDCRVKDCIADALADQRPSDVERNMCEVVGQRIEECDRSFRDNEVRDACLDVAVGLSTAYLDASEDCLSKTCRGITTCLDAAARKFNTDDRIFSGELSLD